MPREVQKCGVWYQGGGEGDWRSGSWSGDGEEGGRAESFSFGGSRRRVLNFMSSQEGYGLVSKPIVSKLIADRTQLPDVRTTVSEETGLPARELACIHSLVMIETW